MPSVTLLDLPPNQRGWARTVLSAPLWGLPLDQKHARCVSLKLVTRSDGPDQNGSQCSSLGPITGPDGPDQNIACTAFWDFSLDQTGRTRIEPKLPLWDFSLDQTGRTRKEPKLPLLDLSLDGPRWELSLDQNIAQCSSLRPIIGPERCSISHGAQCSSLGRSTGQNNAQCASFGPATGPERRLVFLFGAYH